MTRPSSDPRKLRSPDLNRLRWIGVVVPVVFVIGLEVLRATVVERDVQLPAGHYVLAAGAIIGVIVFALAMFSFIERAQRQVIRQNRELAATNAVSTAVQGELGVDVIIDAALDSVIDSIGATEASVTVFSRDGLANEGGIERRRVVAPHSMARPRAGTSLPHLIDIPLSTGPSVVGRMRLHLPAGATEPDLLASATLQNIGHQLASAIQIGQLVGDLQRGQREGHGIYDVLLRISNQNPLPDILDAVVGHARALLASDAAGMTLAAATARLVHIDDRTADLAPIGNGAVRLASGEWASGAQSPSDGNGNGTGTEPPAVARGSVPTDWQASMSAPIRAPEGILGEIWIGRAGRGAYTERDRRYLVTLSDLASIAITNARMRENERQGAIVAERERIAREMHDSLAQILGVTHLRLRALGGKPDVLAVQHTRTELNDLADLTEEAYHDVREAILGLRESSRSDRGLIDSLRAFLEKYSQQSGVSATLVAPLDDELHLSPRSEVQVIRVIQEALTNVRKHSGAAAAVVRITSDDEGTTIGVSDDGSGFDVDSTLRGGDGYGLHTMRERIELIGGTLVVESSLGHGTCVRARIPGIGYSITLPSEVDGAFSGTTHSDPPGR